MTITMEILTAENKRLWERIKDLKKKEADTEKWQMLANQGITIETELRKKVLFLEREIERLKGHG